MCLTLETPEPKHEAEYMAFATELRDNGDGRWVAMIEGQTFAEFLARREREERGEGLEEGIVPHTTYWLVDSEGRLHAELRLRHWLSERLLVEGGNIGYTVRPSSRRQGHGTELLRRGLLEARKRGMERVLITCDHENLGSIGVIEANGGREFTLGFSPITSRPTRKYWIELHDEADHRNH